MEVEAAMCHEGQGVNISPIFFSCGLGDDSDGWKNGFVVNSSHMKKSAGGSEGEVPWDAGLWPVTPSRSEGKGPRITGVSGEETDGQLCCCDRTNDMM